jgi:uncharacterized membrane protein
MGFWYRLSSVVNLFGLQIIRFVFEIFRLIFLLILFIPMLCSSKAYEELNQLFWKDYSEYEKDNENGKTEI